jgi:hypothetical protein
MYSEYVMYTPSMFSMYTQGLRVLQTTLLQSADLTNDDLPPSSSTTSP